MIESQIYTPVSRIRELAAACTTLKQAVRTFLHTPVLRTDAHFTTRFAHCKRYTLFYKPVLRAERVCKSDLHTRSARGTGV